MASVKNTGWVTLLLALPMICASAQAGEGSSRLLDPMRPPEFILQGLQTQTGGALPWVVTAIVSNREGQPVAILNGHVVGEGDPLGDARVVKIQKNQVILRQGSREIALPVLSGDASKGMMLKK